MTHWCRDVQRDIAVRAAEDGRQGPLPTLEEAIAAITNHDAPPGARVSESPCAGHADTGADTAGAGLRTERITLEVTHDLDSPLGDWAVQVIDESLGLNESVRVVEECCLDRINMGEVIRERDAAILERQKAEQRADRDFVKCSALADKVIELRARVAELESAPAARGWLTEAERGALKRAFDLLCDDDGDNPLAGTVQRLLARETPPEVVMPPAAKGETPLVRDLMWGQAIRDAGVAVKEAGSE